MIWTGWTDEAIGALVRMAGDGASAGRIADALGATRNAVIGKAHRIGVAFKGNDHVGRDLGEPVRRPAQTRHRQPSPPRADPLPLNGRPRATYAHGSPNGLKPGNPPADYLLGKSRQDSSKSDASRHNPPITCTPVLFLARRDNQCSWPLWDDATPQSERKCCGGVVTYQRFEWCSHHAERGLAGRAA